MEKTIQLPGYKVHTANCLWTSEANYENPYWYEPQKNDDIERGYRSAIHDRFKSFDRSRFKRIIRMTRFREPSEDEVFDFAQEKIREYVSKRGISPPSDLELLGLRKETSPIRGMLNTLMDYFKGRGQDKNPLYGVLFSLEHQGPEGVLALLRLSRKGDELKRAIMSYFFRSAKESYLSFESTFMPQELLGKVDDGSELPCHRLFTSYYGRPFIGLKMELFTARFNPDGTFPHEIANEVSQSRLEHGRLEVRRPNRNFEGREALHFGADLNLKDDLGDLVNDLKVVSSVFSSRESIQSLRDYSEKRLVDLSVLHLEKIAQKYHIRFMERKLGMVFPELRGNEDTEN